MQVIFVPGARVTVTDPNHPQYGQDGSVTAVSGSAHTVAFDNGVTATLAATQLSYGAAPSGTPQPVVSSATTPPQPIAGPVQLNDSELIHLIDSRIIAIGGAGGGSGYFDSLEMKTAIQNNRFYVDADGNVTAVGMIDGFLDAAGVAGVLPMTRGAGGVPAMPASAPTSTGQVLQTSSVSPQILEWGDIAGVEPAGDYGWTGQHSWTQRLDAPVAGIQIGVSGTGWEELGGMLTGDVGGVDRLGISTTDLRQPSDGAYNFSSTGSVFGAADVGINRNAANTLKVTDGNLGLGDLLANDIDGETITATSFVGDGTGITNVTAVPDITLDYNWEGSHSWEQPLGIGSATGPKINYVDDSTISVTEDDGTPGLFRANRISLTDPAGSYPGQTGIVQSSNLLYLRSQGVDGVAVTSSGLITPGNWGPTLSNRNGKDSAGFYFRLENGGLYYDNVEDIIGITKEPAGGGTAQSALYVDNNADVFIENALHFGSTGPQFNYVDDSTISLTEDDGTTLADLTLGGVSIGHDTPLGNLHVRGSGNTDATNAVYVENSDANEIFRVDDSGEVYIDEGWGTLHVSELDSPSGGIVFDNNASFGQRVSIQNQAFYVDDTSGHMRMVNHFNGTVDPRLVISKYIGGPHRRWFIVAASRRGCAVYRFSNLRG